MADKETVSYVPETDMNEQKEKLFADLYRRLSVAFTNANRVFIEPVPDGAANPDRLVIQGIEIGFRFAAGLVVGLMVPGAAAVDFHSFIGEVVTVGEDQGEQAADPGEGNSG